MIGVLFTAVFFCSLLFTGALRRYAIASSLIDIPNERSSHLLPTPRGGGLAIVISYLIALPLLALIGVTTWPTVISLLGAGGIIALVGFLDDHGHIAARWRLLAHFSGAGWALYWLGSVPSIDVFGVVFSLGWIGYLLGALYLVWLINLYNFMDGIDGIASAEAISVCGGACVIYWLSGDSGLLSTSFLLVAAVSGFLYWNFPPARIFMGDAGSGFLGLVLGILSLQAASSSPRLMWIWLILLGVFVVDATFTLLRRLIRGDKVYEAHRSHAYQYASRQVGRHLPVTLAVVLINALWLMPIAMCVSVFGLDGMLGLLIAYFPLCLLAIKFHAGAVEKLG